MSDTPIWRSLARFQVGCAIGSLLLIGPAALAASKCKISPVAKLPITMNLLRPTIPAKINNRDAQFLLDSGAFYSSISAATAAEYDLKLRPGPFGFRLSGVGGEVAVSLTTVKEFGLVGGTIKNVEFIVAGSEIGAAAGILGQNLLEKFDVEYNLAAGSILLFHTDDCGDAQMAYWVTPGQQYSAMRIDHIEPLHPHTIGVAYLNGKEIKVLFDTGASNSLLSTKAAARAGVKIDSDGVVAAGYDHGIGSGVIKTYIARFDSFKVGDGEEIKNARLRFGDTELPNADMLLGADFFMSHRVFVANKEHRLFLTYNGGPVFDLSKRVVAETAAAAGAAAGVMLEPSAPDNADAATAKPTPSTAIASGDAAELARNGSALAARRDFGPALADLSKAVDLNPNEPDYYFQRANAYLGNQQPDLALADFNQVIKLKEDFLPAYIPRAELELRKNDKTAGMQDLDTVERLAPKPADLRFMLGKLYERVDRYSSAAAQYAIWLQYHEDDFRRVDALSSRCFSLALANEDLPGALSDCSTALRKVDRKLNNEYAHIYVSRGLVRLRQYDYDKAIADFNDALKMLPKTALALYGRGIAELRTNKKADGESDIAAAEVLLPKVAEHFTKFGFGV